MQISIITVCLNNKDTIAQTIQSVAAQNHPDKEHIILDGMSTDGTIDILKRYENQISIWKSEADEGMYDAINKGIALASGDIIGILNADDIYDNPNCLTEVVDNFKTNSVDSVFADLVFVRHRNPNKIVRYCRSKNFKPSKFAFGIMPAHPTVFIRRECYMKYGLFKTDYKIAADFELLARYLSVNKLSYAYIPKVLVRMRLGGRSTRNYKSNFIINKEMYRACMENGINTNFLKIYSKYFVKIFELFFKPKQQSHV